LYGPSFPFFFLPSVVACHIAAGEISSPLPPPSSGLSIGWLRRVLVKSPNEASAGIRAAQYVFLRSFRCDVVDRPALVRLSPSPSPLLSFTPLTG